MKINLIYFGRLEKEKGFDYVIDILKKFDSDLFFINIFGDGTLKSQLLSIKKNNYCYHSRQDKSVINNYLKKSHFTLMPSKFLETFGLSALESLQVGVPVIGFKKGGLEQFVFENLNISNYNGNNDFEKLSDLLFSLKNNFSLQFWTQMSNKCLTLSNNYKLSIRKNNFISLLPQNSKKILIISDYIIKLGGIEIYIDDVKSILNQNGFEVLCLGTSNLNKRYGKVIRQFYLFFSIFNIYYYFKLKTLLKIFKPDVVWCHSLVRNIGWLPLSILSKSDCFKIIMYHDLGYFHPFPSKVYFESQVLKFNLLSFIKMGNTYNPFIIFLIILKYYLLKLIFVHIKSFSIHLIPSQFMFSFVNNIGINKSKIVVLPHFIK